MVSNKTRILVSFEPTGYGYIIIHINGFERGRSQGFYLNRENFSHWLDQAPWKSPTYIDSDICSFLKVEDLENGRLRFTFFWFTAVGDNRFCGHKDIFSLPFSEVSQSVELQKPKRLCAVVEDGHPQARIMLSDNAHRKVHRLRGKKLQKRAFAKAMRDSFHWHDSKVELFADFDDDFYFREKRGEDVGIAGGLCLSQSEIVGKDGRLHPRYSYTVHT